MMEITPTIDQLQKVLEKNFDVSLEMRTERHDQWYVIVKDKQSGKWMTIFPDLDFYSPDEVGKFYKKWLQSEAWKDIAEASKKLEARKKVQVPRRPSIRRRRMG